MKKIIFIEQKKQLSHIDKDYLVISLNEEISNELSKRRISFIEKNFYLKDINIDKLATSWTNSLSNKKIGNKRLKEIFSFEGLSIWWLMKGWLYYSYYFDTIKDLIGNIEFIKKVIGDENPKKIIYPGGNLFGTCVEMVVGKREILLKSLPLDTKHNKFMKYKKRFMRSGLILRSILRLIFSKYLGVFYKKEKLNKNILVFSSPSWENKNDAYVFPILDEFSKKNIPFLYLDYPDPTKTDLKGFRRMFEKIKMKNNFDCAERYLKINNIFKLSGVYKKINKDYEGLKNKKEWQDCFIYLGIPIWDLIEEKFSFFMKSRLYDHLINIIMVKKILDKEDPKVLLYPVECGSTTIICSALARQRNIPFLVIQHGTFSMSPLMVHNNDEISLKDDEKDFIKYYPYPDITFVYGASYKEFITKNSNIPEKRVVVVGNPRYDEIFQYTSSNKSKLVESFGLNPDKKTAVLISQEFFKRKDKIKFLLDSYKVIKELGMQLIVKLHPIESSSSLHEKLAKSCDLKDVVFVKSREENAKLIYISDLVFGPESTFDYEVMILNKPLIVFNETGSKNLLGFVDEGAALEANNKEELKKCIKDVIYDDSKRKKLLEKSKKLIKNHCYKLDGKSSERIVKVVSKSIK